MSIAEWELGARMELEAQRDQAIKERDEARQWAAKWLSKLKSSAISHGQAVSDLTEERDAAREAQAKAEETLAAMSIVCEHCGGTYAATGLETGCACRAVEAIREAYRMLRKSHERAAGSARYSGAKDLFRGECEGIWKSLTLLEILAAKAGVKVGE